MPTENVTTKFKVDISDLKKNIQTANNQIKLLTAEMKNANAGMAKGAETADSLTTKIQKQSQIVQQEENKLQALKDQLARLNQNQQEGERIIADLTAKYQNAVQVYGEASNEAAAYAAELGRAQAAQERNRAAAEKLTIQIVNQDTAVKNAQSQVKTFENALDNLDKEVIDVGDDTKETTNSGINAFGVALGNLASQAITLVIDKLSDMVKAVKDAYLGFDKGRDAVVKATGATGKAADDLTKSYTNVSKTIKTASGSFEDIGEALGEVNTRFGFTDEQLEESTRQFIKFADITGTDAKDAVRLVSRAMGDAGINAEDYSGILDALAVAAQASGISIDKLTEYITKYGAPMRALGFDTNESIAIFSQWEQAGVNTEIAFSGMKNAISSWSKEGKNAKDEFKKTLEQIAAAPDIASATTQAIEVFGKKAGPDLADAIQNGRFEYSRFLELIENSEGTVNATYDETQTAVDKTALALQNVKTTAAALVNEYVEKYSPQIQAAINSVTQKIEKAVPNIKLYIIGVIPKNDEAGNLALIKTLGLENKIALTGEVQAADMPQLLKNAEALVLDRPNNTQAKCGFATKMGEYLLTKNPVIVTEVGDFNLFLAHKESVVFAEPDNINDFAEKVIWVLENKELATKIGEEGYNVAMKYFTYESVVKKIIKQMSL